MLARFEASPQNDRWLERAEDPGETLPASDSQIEAMMMESSAGGSKPVSPSDGKSPSPSTPSLAPSDSVSKAEKSDEEPYQKLVFFLNIDVYSRYQFEHQKVWDVFFLIAFPLSTSDSL